MPRGSNACRQRAAGRRRAPGGCGWNTASPRARPLRALGTAAPGMAARQHCRARAPRRRRRTPQPDQPAAPIEQVAFRRRARRERAPHRPAARRCATHRRSRQARRRTASIASTRATPSSAKRLMPAAAAPARRTERGRARVDRRARSLRAATTRRARDRTPAADTSCDERSAASSCELAARRRRTGRRCTSVRLESRAPARRERDFRQHRERAPRSRPAASARRSP